MHTPKAERRFLIHQIEAAHGQSPSSDQRINFWTLLAKSESFDRFAAKKFPTVKRYGLEGGESLMVVFDEILQAAKERRVEDIVV